MFVAAVPAFFERIYYPDSMDWKELLSQSNLIYSLLTVAFQMFWTVMYINGAQRTTQMQAYVLSNLQGPCNVIINLIFGVKPLSDEKTGLLFAIAGAILVTVDPLALRVDGYVTSNSTFVSLAVSSVVGTAYMYFNGKNTIEYRLYFMIFYQSLLMFLLSSIFAVLSSGGKATFFSVDPVWGCFGFLSPTAFETLIILQGVMSGFFGTWG
jgi:hypothetical protein